MDTSPLLDRHHTLHRALLDLLEDALVDALALRFRQAADRLATLMLALETHQRDEEAALSSLVQHQPPRGASPTLIVAEHHKLDALITDARATLAALADLAELPPDTQRLALVRHLDTLLRPRHLLEHHTTREDDILYPHLLAHLSPATRHALETSLAALITTLGASP